MQIEFNISTHVDTSSMCSTAEHSSVHRCSQGGVPPGGGRLECLANLLGCVF